MPAAHAIEHAVQACRVCQQVPLVDSEPHVDHLTPGFAVVLKAPSATAIHLLYCISPNARPRLPSYLPRWLQGWIAYVGKPK